MRPRPCHRPGTVDARDPRRDRMAAQAAILYVRALRRDGHDDDAVRRLAVAEAIRALESTEIDWWSLERLVCVVQRTIEAELGKGGRS